MVRDREAAKVKARAMVKQSYLAIPMLVTHGDNGSCFVTVM